MPFRKVLIANRGEIAVRVIRGCRELNVRTVAVFSDPDRTSIPVRMADEAAHLGPAPARDSYLCIEQILRAARRHSVDAIHPGYGFLSENAEFAQACEDAGFTFIGPAPGSIRLMGSKTNARRLVQQAGVPVLPGTAAELRLSEMESTAREIGYPVLIKADAGGGGKGMRRIDNPNELESALRDASSEAERSFRSGSVYIEKLLDRPRHIEIQVLGDRHGRLIHLGERECSIQRRHQKVIEESPSPFVTGHPELRSRMGCAAVQAAQAAGYYNAGTVEFLVDQKGEFYFLEMNTRLQVEHPVTELVTGLDLVHWQLRIAAGEPLTITQDHVEWRGAAMECRIYAEDPEQDFLPSPGTISRLHTPAGPGVRLDSGVYKGWTVPLGYDPLLAKLAVWAETRPLAISRMQRAIAEFSIGGIATNLAFFGEILRDAELQDGNLHTGFIEEWRKRRQLPVPSPEAERVAAFVAAAGASARNQQVSSNGSVPSRWVSGGRGSMLR